MSNPLVSVIIPVHNGEKYLREAIESVLRQSIEDYELIVIDDGSTDGTPGVAQSYGALLKYVRQDNRGAAAAFNHGIRVSTGRYISWLSHDDVFVERKLEVQITACAKYDMPVVCYTDLQIINDDGQVIAETTLPEYKSGDVLWHIVTGGPIGQASYSIMFDRRCVDEVGFYDEARPYTQDADMLLRLARRFPFVHVPEHLMQMREHENRGQRAQSTKWQKEAVAFYREWLNRLALTELRPDLGENASRLKRARERCLLGDIFALRPFPFRWIAISEYRKAMGESLLVLPEVVPKLLKSYVRLFYGWRSLIHL